MALNKALAALLVVVFVTFTMAVILVWSVQMRILDPGAYVNVADQTGFFEMPYVLIRDGHVPDAGGVLLLEGPLAAVSGAELEAVARELAPPDWLRAQLEEAIRDLVAVAQRPETGELPDLIISLKEVKERALGEPGERALAIVIEALPACAPGQAPVDLGSGRVVCKPAELDLNAFTAQLKTFLVPFVERVPDTYRVTWQPEQQDTLEDLRRAGQTLEQLRFALLLLLALNLALLGLIWVLVVRSPAEWLRWTGIPLLLVGVLAVLLAVVMPAIVGWSLDLENLWTRGSTPASLAVVLEEAIPEFTQLLFRPARFAGLLLAGVGLLLAVVSPLFPARRPTPPVRYR